MAVRVEDVYDEHIQHLSPAEKLHLVELIARKLAEVRIVSASGQSNSRDITELHGLGAEIWHGIDPQEYIDESRDEWDKRQ